MTLLCLMSAVVASCGSPDDANDGAGESSRDGSRQTIVVAREGGQTGMEGGCGPRPEPKPFAVEDVRALIEGSRSTRMVYRLERASLDATSVDGVGLPLNVNIELEGEPRVLDPSRGEGCDLRVAQDVEVTLSFEQPPLDVVIETTAHAFSSDFAIMQLKLGSDVAGALGLPATDVTFSLSFDENGMKGTLDPHDDCGIAVFPASVRCPQWPNSEVDLDRERDGFRPRDALSLLDELGEIPLRWTDGTETLLTLSLIQSPYWACSDEWIESDRPERLDLPIVVHLVTADGRLEAELPAELSVEVATEVSASLEAAAASGTGGGTPGVVQSFSVHVAYFGDGQPGSVGYKVNVWNTDGAPRAEGFIHTVYSRAISVAPPLDATLDTSARCLYFAPGAAPEFE